MHIWGYSGCELVAGAQRRRSVAAHSQASHIPIKYIHSFTAPCTLVVRGLGCAGERPAKKIDVPVHLLNPRPTYPPVKKNCDCFCRFWALLGKGFFLQKANVDVLNCFQKPKEPTTEKINYGRFRRGGKNIPKKMALVSFWPLTHPPTTAVSRGGGFAGPLACPCPPCSVLRVRVRIPNRRCGYRLRARSARLPAARAARCPAARCPSPVVRHVFSF
jgi:hypothetical protein